MIDDDRATRELLGQLLTGEGYAVATVSHSEAALELLRHVRPEVIVLDLRLPRTDAGPFLEHYRRLGAPPPPIVLLSAARDLKRHAEDLGATAYVEKPFELDDLKKAIERCVASA